VLDYPRSVLVALFSSGQFPTVIDLTSPFIPIGYAIDPNLEAGRDGV